MLVMPQTLEINWTGQNRKHFESKRYTFTGYKTSFKVDVLDLQPRSDRMVKAECSLCNTPKDVVFKFIKKKMEKGQTYVCHECKGQRISDAKIQYYNGRNASIDPTVFLKDSPELAYLAGLIATDGTVSKENYRIELTMADKDVIEWVHTFTKCKNPIRHYNYKEKKSTYQDQWKVAFSNKTAREALKRYGVVPNKSLSLEFPSLNKELLPHFIRGVFDGDGSVVPNYTQYKRFVQVTFKTGSLSFATGLKKAIENETGINCSLLSTHQNDTVYYSVSFTKWESILKFYAWIYDGGHFSMERKKQKFELCIEEYLGIRN